jgi:hypothetical protein
MEVIDYKNHISYWRFRDGILKELGFKPDDLSIESIKKIIKDVEDNWWFCGGRDTDPYSDTPCPYDTVEWQRLWTHYHGGRDMPITTEECVCSYRGLRYNLFITDGPRLITIGSKCMTQFLPRIAKQVKQKRCSKCDEPHKNRIDNYCNTCRPIVRKQEREEKEQAILKERLERETQERAKKQEKERMIQKRQEEEEMKRQEEEMKRQEEEMKRQEEESNKRATALKIQLEERQKKREEEKKRDEEPEEPFIGHRKKPIIRNRYKK